MLSVNIDKVILNRGASQEVLLSNVIFELGGNCIYTIVGKNGSGKSTFIKTITGLTDKRFYSTHGQVIFEGRDLLRLNHEEIKLIRKEKIKYVFQDAKSSFDHLKRFNYYFRNLNVCPEEIEKYLEYFLLPSTRELFNLYPYEISGGMAQRLSLVLALLAKPKLIILDEPTSGIDSAISNLFLLKLKEFVNKNSNSVLLVTQDLKFAEMISDRIALLTVRKLTKFLPPNKFYKSQENISSDELINSYLQITT